MQIDTHDKAFRNGHVKIENVYPHLKNGWQILKNLNFNVPYYGHVIFACCILHKFCKLHAEELAKYPPLPRVDCSGFNHPR